ncbi:Rv2175c family DNA-binding protein [Arcanobacterium haemolyticum]
MIKEPGYDEWLSIPEIADILNLRQRDVRTAVADHRLVAIRRGENNAWAVNGGQIIVKDGEAKILPSLHGTLIALQDAGFSSDESLAWLLRHDEELECAPLHALRDGKTHAVRRVIIGLAF